MKRALSVCLAMGLLAMGGPAGAQAPSTSTVESPEGSVPISRLIAAVAKRTGKKFIVEPRVHADVVLVGQDPSSISYGDFLAILQIYGFAAVEGGGYVRVIPDAMVRTMAIPQVSGKESYPDAEHVTKVIPVKNTPAALLVPILRALLPQSAHLAAAICSNTLIVVDTFANVRRIETLVQSLDTGTPYKPERCQMPEPPPPRDAPAVKRE